MLEPGCVYHIYNRANGKENLFREEENYRYFLKTYFDYLNPVADTFAWCLMPNHFHVMIRIKSNLEITGSSHRQDLATQCQSNLFNAYAKAYNKKYSRSGSLFQRPFKHKEVESNDYFTQLILYIHNNPVKHGFVKSPMDWPYSSLRTFLTLPDLTGFQNLSGLSDGLRTEVLDRFGGLDLYKKAHENIGEIKSLFD